VVLERNGGEFIVSSPLSASAIVNSTPNDFFDSDRDLNQGDPLSPLFFILVMETFRRLMSRAMERGFIDGFSVSSGNTESNITFTFLPMIQ
jgi:hypothetical protein